MNKYIKVILLATVSVLFIPVPVGQSFLFSVSAALVLLFIMLFTPRRKPKFGEFCGSALPDYSGGVTVSIQDGQLGGTIQTNDGLTGMVLTGLDEGDYVLGDTIKITGMTSLASAGITATNNPFAYKQVKEFYSIAGEGARLYLMLVPNTMTIADMCDVSNVNGARKLLMYGNGAIKVIGVMTDDKAMLLEDEDSVTNTDGINDDIATAINNLHAMLNSFAAVQRPSRGLIGATSVGDTDELTDLLTLTKNRVGLVIGDTDITYSSRGAALGLALGKVAILPVQRKISRRKDGSLPNTKAYLGSAEITTLPYVPENVKALGYITMITQPNLEGLYFGSDSMCAPTTNDYCMLARGRVIDKAHILAYTVFSQEVDDEVPINEDGTIDNGFVKWLEQQIVNQINNTMTANGEISSVSCYINPAQNVLSTNTLNVVLKIVPKGYASTIVVSLGFNNPALAA